MELLRTQNVSFQYENPEELPLSVLRDVSLTVRRGEFLAVLGHNGSGNPTAGAVWVENLSTADEAHWLDIRRTVGMVLQNPDNQLVSTIVEEDVAFGPENLGIEPKEIRRRVDDAMALMGVSEYARHAPSKLSGGQKQRVAIAGLMAMEPQCMILDEATAMLDPRGRKEVMDTVLRLNREKGITVLHITHHMDEAALADRVVVIDDGRVLLDGTPGEVFSKVGLMQSVGLEVLPQTELLYELTQCGLPLPDHVTDAEECARVIFEYYQSQKKA